MKCLLDAAIHILNVRTWRNPDIDPAVNKVTSDILRETFISFIGHDGSDRGFHTQEISDALNDLGCRFVDGSGNTVGRSAQQACILGDDGELSFVSSQSQIQYCATISMPLAFPKGDTLLTVRIRNTSGISGDVKQIIIHSES